ncbi:hypothetical protein ACOALA_04100 [Alicyclobacillus acidoterrestris]|uniref:hypothetical protein n=1 Tax=Alicyclobacillus acidoterrestris TaxID=1450 RepID=UPI003F52B7E3
MTAQNPMAVTAANIIMGPCTSFTVDGNETGGTSGGVSMTRKETLVAVTVDQYTADVAHGIKDQQVTIKTTVSEATLQNLAMAWDMGAPVAGTDPASLTLNLLMATGMKTEHALVFVGPAPPPYSTRTYTVPKAISIVSAEETIIKDKEKGYVLEFQVHPDLTNPAAPFGTIVDQ